MNEMYDLNLMKRHNTVSSLTLPIDRDRLLFSLERWTYMITGKTIPIMIAETFANYMIPPKGDSVEINPKWLIEVMDDAATEASSLDWPSDISDHSIRRSNVFTAHWRELERITRTWHTATPVTIHSSIGFSAIAYAILAYHNDAKQQALWLPLLEAVEAGLFAFKAEDGRLVVTLKPTIAAFDSENRFHSESGMALQYLDLERYYWHGIEVPAWLINNPERITPELMIATANAEVRRVMIELYGAERLINDAKSIVVDHQQFKNRSYQLNRVNIPNDESIQMLMVTNATAEPDGSFKNYWLRVPPWIDNALEAVAWTFELTVPEYQTLFFES